ncbi:hypothetical protein D3C87_125240 [compost metagenome]
MSQFAPTSQNKPRGLFWILYGVGGVGKTEQALKLHGPDKTYLLNLELRAGHVDGVVGVSRTEENADGTLKIPDLKSIYSLIDYIADSNYRAFVIDSYTLLVGYIFAHVNGKKFEYSAEGGWENKNKAVEEAEKLAKYIQTKLVEKGIDVIMPAHEKMAPYNDPKEEKPYDRFTIDAPHDAITKVFIRLADNVGFCHYDVEKRGENGKNKIKVDGKGERSILFENRPWATDCKNSSGLSAYVDMDKEANNLRAALAAAKDNRGKTAAQLQEDVRALCQSASPDIRKASLLALSKAGDDKIELARLKEKLSIAVSA